MVSDRKMVVQPPTRERGSAELVRVLAESAAQAFPLTAALAMIYHYTHPSRMEEDLRRFHVDVANKLSDHDQILRSLQDMLRARYPLLGEAAMDLVVDMLRADTKGRGGLILMKDIPKSSARHVKRYYEDAAAELNAYGYVSIQAAVGHAIAGLRPQLSAYVAFDLVAFGYDTQADAIEIASLLKSHDDLGSMSRLQGHLGWELRHLNPALSALLIALPDCIRSSEVSEWVTSQIIVGPNERFLLKRISQSRRLEL